MHIRRCPGRRFPSLASPGVKTAQLGLKWMGGLGQVGSFPVLVHGACFRARPEGSGIVSKRDVLPEVSPSPPMTIEYRLRWRRRQARAAVVIAQPAMATKLCISGCCACKGWTHIMMRQPCTALGVWQTLTCAAREVSWRHSGIEEPEHFVTVCSGLLPWMRFAVYIVQRMIGRAPGRTGMQQGPRS